MTEILHSENKPLIDELRRLHETQHKLAMNATEPRFVDLQHGDRLLYFRKPDGELVQREVPRTPPRTTGQHTTITPEGFRDAINALFDGESPTTRNDPFVHYRDGKVIATLNPGTLNNRDYGDVRVVLDPPLSPEWVRWCDFCESVQSRATAADFIDDNEADFASSGPGDTLVSRTQLREWLDRLTLKVVRELDEGENDESASTRAEGSATIVQVTRLALRVHEGGPVIGFRCRWRAGLGPDGRLAVKASIVNEEEAVRRVWLGPVPEGAQWTPLVQQVSDLIEQPVII